MKERTRHLKKAGIEARLVMVDILPLDEAYDEVSQALERQDAALDLEIPAAAIWLAFTGQRIYAGAKIGERTWGLTRKSVEGSHMSLDRWYSWKRRLRKLARKGGQCGVVRKGAADALAHMEEADRLDGKWWQEETSSEEEGNSGEQEEVSK